MKLTPKNLLALSELAQKAVLSAGTFINQELKRLKTNNTTLEVNSKSTGENLASQVVTQVDLSAQKIILDILNTSISDFDLGLLTEESEDNQSRFEKDYFWCIDPLDGTLPFIEQTTGYAISIALVSNSGIPVIGVVFDPTTPNLYTAIEKQGVTKNNQPLNLASSSKTLHFIHDRSFLKHPNYNQVLQALRFFQKSNKLKELEIISHGGAVMNAIWCIENAPACYFKFAKPTQGGGSLWDYAATTCIYKELGHYIGDMKGRPLQLNRKGSSFMNEDGVLYSSDEELAEVVLGLGF